MTTARNAATHGVALLLIAHVAHAADRLQLDPAGLSPAQQQVATQTLADVQSLLPDGLLRALPAQVQVRWSDGLPAEVHGRAFAGRITLRRDLLDDGMPGARRARRSALVHELTHVADRTAANWSRSMRWRDLAGWQRKPWHIGRGDNDFRDRSPDAYELKDPAEYLAVNAEHFVLDSEFACRRPALAQWYQMHFGTPPSLPQPQCATTLPLLQAESEEGAASLLQLDPARVYAVDYLFAEGSAQPMSRWGHSMLRLVVCAPGRPRGPDCRLDLDHHLVLSYRAFVGDLQLSSWDGLTGVYPSRLFVLPLEQVIDEYTKVELRSLASVPLRLTRDELEQMVVRAAEQHWSYDGDYYFVSNNCAVETLKLLRSGTGNPRLQALDSILPNGLLELMDARGLADTSVLDDPREALRLGYRFDSFRERYQAMFRVLRERLPIQQDSVETWLEQPAQDRSQWFAKADLRASAALLLLEQAALRRQLLLAQDELKRRYLTGRAAGDPSLNKAGAALEQILANSGFLSRPAELLKGGYGLPQQAEWERLEASSRDRQQQLRQLSDELDGEVRNLLQPHRLAELEANEANLVALGAHLRALHKASGGLELP